MESVKFMREKIEPLIKIAQEAGREILDVYNSSINIEYK